jgi:hypothetical protein
MGETICSTEKKVPVRLQSLLQPLANVPPTMPQDSIPALPACAFF